METNTNTSPAADIPHVTTSSVPVVRTPKVLLAWDAPSHHNHERSHRWYLVGGVLILIIAVYGILASAWTLSVVSILVGGMYYLTRREPARLKNIRIESDGVQFENAFTPWSQCKEFWLTATPLFTELRIVREGLSQSDIRIQTADIDPAVIRSTLSQFLPMRADQREKLLDIIIRICKL